MGPRDKSLVFRNIHVQALIQKHMVHKCLSSFIPLLLIFSCNRGPINYWALEEVEYIQSFPATIKPNEYSDYGKSIDIPGVLDVKVWGDYLLLSSRDGSGYIYVYTKSTGESLGNFLLRGNGPTELLYPTFFSKFQFFDRGAMLVNEKGNLLFWDILKSCYEHTTVCENLRTLPTFSYDNGALNYYAVNDTVFIGNGIDNSIQKKNRFILVEDEYHETRAMSILNEIRLPKSDPGRINILSSIFAINSEKGMIVEASVKLNSIQLYSIDGTTAKTLCIGSSLEDINSVWNRSQQRMPISFLSPRAYDKFFAVLYIDATEFEYDLFRTHPEILVFDWGGNPLFKIKLPIHATSFDIDWNENKLYTVDHENDNIYVFDFEAPLVLSES